MRKKLVNYLLINLYMYIMSLSIITIEQHRANNYNTVIINFIDNTEWS